MASLVVNSLEMWEKCSFPGVMLNFRKTIIFQKQYIIFTPQLEGKYFEPNFKYLYKKYFSGVSGTYVIQDQSY